MRAQFKNDNYFLASQRQKEKQKIETARSKLQKLAIKAFYKMKFQMILRPFRIILQKKGIKANNKNNIKKQQYEKPQKWKKTKYQIQVQQQQKKIMKQLKQQQKMDLDNQRIIANNSTNNVEQMFKVSNPFKFSSKIQVKKQDQQFQKLKSLFKAKKQTKQKKNLTGTKSIKKQITQDQKNTQKLAQFLSQKMEINDKPQHQSQKQQEQSFQEEQLGKPSSRNNKNKKITEQKKIQIEKQESTAQKQKHKTHRDRILQALQSSDQQEYQDSQDSQKYLTQQQLKQKRQQQQQEKYAQLLKANEQLKKLGKDIKVWEQEHKLNQQKLANAKQHGKQLNQNRQKDKKKRKAKAMEKQKNQQNKNSQSQNQPNQKGPKKIKKVNNYQRLDLKRKFKDRFVGGLRQNQMKYMKNGVLKPKYRMAQSELQIQDGEVYNTFIHSLSKSLLVNISLQSDSQKQQSQQQKHIVIPTIQQSSKQNLTQLIKQIFGFQCFREGQYEVIKSVLNYQSTIFVSQTASGKSLSYIMASLIMAQQKGGMSIVISPLIALMLDQLEHLPLQIPAACLSSLLNYDQRKKILQMIKQEKIKLLFMTPQMLMTDILFHVKQFPAINFVCVDEAHCLSQFSHNFRTSYLALSEIILNHIKYNNQKLKPNILCLTATANTQTISSLQKKLNIVKTIKSSSTLNKNLYITITRQIGSESKYRSLVEYLSNKQILKCQGTLVYCRSKYIIDKVFNYLINSGIPCTVFHAALTNKEKTRIISQFKQKKVKTIISTTALGMGLDFQHLDCIVHFNMAKSLESFVQQIGRAGRRQNRAYCQLFLDQSDYLMERNYILADQLQESSLQKIIKYIEKSAYLRGNKMTKRSSKTKQKSILEQNQDQFQRVIQKASLKIQKLQQLRMKKQQSGNIQDQQSQSNPFEQKELSAENQNMEIDTEQNFDYLCFIRVKQLSQATYLRQQALLTILLKISQMVNNYFFPPHNNKDKLSTDLLNEQKQQKQSKIMSILPLSHQIIKLSFFKSNQNQLINSQKFGSFYKKLVQIDQNDQKKVPKCKKVNGSYHINLISKCNQMKMKPIQLLAVIYQISNEYVIKVQFVNQVYLFSIKSNFINQSVSNLFNQQEFTFCTLKNVIQLLSNNEFQQDIIKSVNQVQNTSMTKLNVFYSLAFDYSQISMQQLQNKNLIISRQSNLSKDNIMNQITKYFNTDLYSFYNYIGQSEDQLQRQVFLPTQIIEPNEYQPIYENIKLFFKHQYSNLRDLNDSKHIQKKKNEIFQEFKDGKIITRVFLGVNQQKSSKSIYGEHSYWRRFIKKKYLYLLKTVRELIKEGKEDLLRA